MHLEGLAFVGSFEFVLGGVPVDVEEIVEGFALGLAGGEEAAAAAEEACYVESHCGDI